MLNIQRLGFHRALALSFLLGSFAFIWAANFLVDREFPPERALLEEFSKSMNPAWFDLTIIEAGRARQEQRFWTTLNPYTPEGVALDLLGNPDLFRSAFPGYPDEMMKDRELWGNYFQRIFFNAFWLPPLSNGRSTGLMVHGSWIGCLDVVKKYGADVLIIGASDTYSALIPALLNKKLDKFPLKNPRILVCADGAMTPAAILKTAEAIEGLQVRVKWIIWGFNPQVFLQPAKFNYSAKLQDEQINQWISKRGSEATKFDLGRFAQKLQWDKIIRRGLQWITSDRPQSYKMNYLPAKLMETPELLDVAAQKMPLMDKADTLSAAGCQFNKVAEGMDRILAAFSRISEKKITFLPPTSSIENKWKETCFWPWMTKAYADRRSHRNLMLLPSRKDHALGFRHHVFLTADTSVVSVDQVHFNYSGAQRVTELIADAMLKNAKIKSEGPHVHQRKN